MHLPFRGNACLQILSPSQSMFYFIAIFKYSGYSETVKLGGVTNLVQL